MYDSDLTLVIYDSVEALYDKDHAQAFTSAAANFANATTNRTAVLSATSQFAQALTLTVKTPETTVATDACFPSYFAVMETLRLYQTPENKHLAVDLWSRLEALIAHAE